MIPKEKLDQLVLDIEFLIISVVQAVALGALATFAVSIFEQFQPEYFAYVAAGFLFVLLFWSGAIIHAISFINWPLDLGHNFLYFLASFVEVIAFGQMTHPARWFLTVTIFFMVAAILYFFDYRLIKLRQDQFQSNRKKLYQHILKRHIFEMTILVPSGILFNFIFLLLVSFYPQVFIVNHWHIALIILEIIFSLGLMVNSILSFQARSKLISEIVAN